MPSKTQVDRAGRRMAEALAAGHQVSETESLLLDAWREAHAEPLHWVTSLVKRRVGDAEAGSAVANRLKRKPQIIAKLARGGSMRLAQMQDVGGCRVVLENAQEVSQAIASIKNKARPWYSVKHEADYRELGRATTGYRAVHLVVERDDLQIEIQFRTRRQHLWAEAVERAAIRTSYGLKDGHGPSDLLEYFRLAADCIARVEAGSAVPAESRARFRDLDQQISKYFPNRPAWTGHEAKLGGTTTTSGANYWILVYNWRDARFERWSNLGSDSADAAKQYAYFENRYPPSSGYEVVLVGADSAETIERTHAHYFARSADDLDPQGLFAQLM